MRGKIPMCVGFTFMGCFEERVEKGEIVSAKRMLWITSTRTNRCVPFINSLPVAKWSATLRLFTGVCIAREFCTVDYESSGRFTLKVVHRQDFTLSWQLLENNDWLLCLNERNVTSKIIGDRKRAYNTKNSPHGDCSIVTKLYVVEPKVCVLVQGWWFHQVNQQVAFCLWEETAKK